MPANCSHPVLSTDSPLSDPKSWWFRVLINQTLCQGSSPLASPQGNKGTTYTACGFIWTLQKDATLSPWYPWRVWIMLTIGSLCWADVFVCSCLLLSLIYKWAQGNLKSFVSNCLNTKTMSLKFLQVISIDHSSSRPTLEHMPLKFFHQYLPRYEL